MSSFEIDNLNKRLIRLYESKYGRKPQYGSFAPGRVNLIGEHTGVRFIKYTSFYIYNFYFIDYNGGYVLPFALPFRTIVVGSPNGSNFCEVESLALEKNETLVATFEVGEGPTGPLWTNYIKGVVKMYEQDLPPGTGGFNCFIISDVPLGSGLSSSASFEYVNISLFLQSRILL
jgi:galactokinase